MRPGWTEYFLGVANAVAARSDCTRRQVGAVVVNNNRIVSTGYVGAPAGRPGCLEGACPRGRHYQDRPVNPDMLSLGWLCGCGDEWPCRDYVQPGSSYDTGAGSCISVHAEANAIIYADYGKCAGATLYCTDKPCDGCQRLIDGAGITSVIYPS